MSSVEEQIITSEQDFVKGTTFKPESGSKQKSWLKPELALVFNLTILVTVYYQESQSIFVFFGTDSNSNTVHTCERYDILSGKWNSVLLQNYLPGFDVTFGAGLVVNKDQILIFGGLRDSMYFPGHLYFNKKLLLFNTLNDR